VSEFKKEELCDKVFKLRRNLKVETTKLTIVICRYVHDMFGRGSLSKIIVLLNK